MQEKNRRTGAILCTSTSAIFHATLWPMAGELDRIEVDESGCRTEAPTEREVAPDLGELPTDEVSRTPFGLGADSEAIESETEEDIWVGRTS